MIYDDGDGRDDHGADFDGVGAVAALIDKQFQMDLLLLRRFYHDALQGLAGVAVGLVLHLVLYATSRTILNAEFSFVMQFDRSFVVDVVCNLFLFSTTVQIEKRDSKPNRHAHAKILHKPLGRP